MKVCKVRVEFHNGNVFEDTVSAWLWYDVIMNNIKASKNVANYSVEHGEIDEKDYK